MEEVVQETSKSIVKIKDNIKLLHSRGHYLLTTGEKSFEVNQSFAEVWEIAVADSFTSESLINQIMEKYDLSRVDAEREISRMIKLWNSLSILEESD